MGYRTADLQLIDLCAVILNWAKQKNGSHDGRVAAQVQHFPSSSQIAAWDRSYKTFFSCNSCEIFQRPCHAGNTIRTVKSSDLDGRPLWNFLRCWHGFEYLGLGGKCQSGPPLVDVKVSYRTPKAATNPSGEQKKSDVVIRAHILLDIFSLMT